MTSAQFSEALQKLGQKLLSDQEDKQLAIEKAYVHNPWFTPEFIHYAIEGIVESYLDPEKWLAWVDSYGRSGKSKNVGIIMAGNLPLVGFHDLLCVLSSGHRAIIKTSDKDRFLPKFVTDKWIEIIPDLAGKIIYADKLVNYDAVIATGSDSSARYFNYYFRDVPHIIRHHRNGVGVIRGDESMSMLKGFADDIFLYFGLGCRNISRIFVPDGYRFDQWGEAISKWEKLADHTKYRNNLDYNYAIYIINQVPHIHFDQLILKEDDSIHSRIGCVHYTYYQTEADVAEYLNANREAIQCVVSHRPLAGWEHVPPGSTQRPSLTSYSDGIDTMQFLNSLN